MLKNIVKICCFLDDGAGMKVAFHKAFASSEFVKLHSHVRIFLRKSLRKGECSFILLRYVKV